MSTPEDEEVNDEQEEDSDDEPINPLVDALFDEIEDLRLRVSMGSKLLAAIGNRPFQLYEAEMRCAMAEAETREEVMREMEERMRAVEKTYALRLMSEVRRHIIHCICFAHRVRQVERNERKMDAKIDMLHQAGLLGTAKKSVIMTVSNSESEIEDIVGDVRISYPVMESTN